MPLIPVGRLTEEKDGKASEAVRSYQERLFL